MARTTPRVSLPEPRSAEPNAAVWGALGTIYVLWGSTYLAIRFAIRTIPPMASASLRFLIAGAALYAWAARRGDRTDRPGFAEWRSAAIVGTLLFLGGNGGVVWAERTVPSGVVALEVATVPLWIALLDRVVYGQRLRWPAVVGLLIGFGGMALLVGLPQGHLDPRGLGFGLAAPVAWAIGSLYARHAPLPKRLLLGAGMEMLAGGVAIGIVSLALGEAGDFHPSAVSAGSAVALAYLVVFGSLVAYSAYVFLLRETRISLVATYAYVNPVVAVFLGWLFLTEPITVRTLAAGAAIVVAVALIVTASTTGREGSPEAEAHP